MNGFDSGTWEPCDADYNIAVRTGLQCARKYTRSSAFDIHGTVRMSIGAFTTRRREYCYRGCERIAAIRIDR
ncbi:MAG: hypothetical protein ACLU4J_00885 [Butyricimonas paravirosa]